MVAMEVAVVSAFIGAILPRLVLLTERKYKLQSDLSDAIRSITDELRMILALFQEMDSQPWDLDAIGKEWILQVRDLAHQIEDCTDQFMHRVTIKPDGFFRRTAHGVVNMPASIEFGEKIKKLKKRSEEVHSLGKRYKKPADISRTSVYVAPEPYVPEDQLIGIDKPRRELEDLIMEEDGQQKQLKVISIVGFGGLGKTILARQVYNGCVGKQFSTRAWVRSSGKTEKEILQQILLELRSETTNACHLPDSSDGATDTADIIKLSEELRLHLDKKKYFIVIDDLRTGQWKSIKGAFPANEHSRIMVTTRNRQVANACSSNDGYFYYMRALEDNFSTSLFLKEDPSNCRSYNKSLKLILKKCDGLPLALVSVAQFLMEKHYRSTEVDEACHRLGDYLEKHHALQRMQKVLVDSYASVSCSARASLLYFGMFPGHRPIRRETLTTRWIAEGFVQMDTMEIADNFKELVDHNVIRAIDVRYNDEVKTCRTHGMMLEFIVKKSVSENFITRSFDENDQARNIRRLFYQSSITDNKILPSDLSFVRSLTIFGTAPKAILDFRKCKLLRVLDLENCESLESSHLKQICKLRLLKYLSLGANISDLPKKISKLRCLETLDLRKTDINTLPVEVIELTHLVHLFGKFKLQDCAARIDNLQKFLSENSRLETVKGFVIDRTKGFAQLMSHINNLKKVKIWLKSSADDRSFITDLSTSINKYTEDENVGKRRTLSIDFEESSDEFLRSLEVRRYLKSLKLRGKLHNLPEFVTSLGALEELCLSSTTLSWDMLQVLNKLENLSYLKLEEDNVSEFAFKAGQLQGLKRLCLVMKTPNLPTIEKGALPFLKSLQLFRSKNLKGALPLGNTIELLQPLPLDAESFLKSLVEVSLDFEVTNGTEQLWEEAAKKHPERPNILWIKRDNSITGNGRTKNTVVREQSRQETGIMQHSNVPTAMNSGSAPNPKGKLHSTSRKTKLPRFFACLPRFAQRPERKVESENKLKDGAGADAARMEIDQHSAVEATTSKSNFVDTELEESSKTQGLLRMEKGKNIQIEADRQLDGELQKDNQTSGTYDTGECSYTSETGEGPMTGVNKNIQTELDGELVDKGKNAEERSAITENGECSDAARNSEPEKKNEEDFETITDNEEIEKEHAELGKSSKNRGLPMVDKKNDTETELDHDNEQGGALERRNCAGFTDKENEKALDKAIGMEDARNGFSLH